MFVEDKANGEPTMKGFYDFVKSKSPEEKYEWMHCGICACGQYSKSLGIASWTDYPGFSSSIWPTANQVAGYGEATFGALAARLEKVT